MRGAEAYKKGLKNIKSYFFETGHFALEEEAPAIGARILESLGGKGER